MRTTRRVALAAALGYAALHVLGRQAGSTRQERRARLPGDELVPDGPPGTAWFVVEHVDAPRRVRGIRDRAEAAPPPQGSGRRPHQACGHDATTPVTGP
ncbi:hypothetical protein [Kineosporia sp. R_H_3]|uniref:hypothetical protein n=1 Tax=Kineosporia sp. R_H_3 TaxID=1961848 RepID=UPI000B4B0F83|nr:hypothetical protein [Kineosporia sp. R_H_3]